MLKQSDFSRHILNENLSPGAADMFVPDIIGCQSNYFCIHGFQHLVCELRFFPVQYNYPDNLSFLCYLIELLTVFVLFVMDIKVDGKELHQLSSRELKELDKQVRLALTHVKQNGFRKFQVGDRVRVEKSNWSAEGIIEEIGARTATVNIGEEKILTTPRMISKI